jgi:hypothetical protein
MRRKIKTQQTNQKEKNLTFLKCKGCCNLHNVPCLQTTCTLKVGPEGGGYHHHKKGSKISNKVRMRNNNDRQNQ